MEIGKSTAYCITSKHVIDIFYTLTRSGDYKQKKSNLRLSYRWAAPEVRLEEHDENKNFFNVKSKHTGNMIHEKCAECQEDYLPWPNREQAADFMAAIKRKPKTKPSRMKTFWLRQECKSNTPDKCLTQKT